MPGTPSRNYPHVKEFDVPLMCPEETQVRQLIIEIIIKKILVDGQN
jgi:hypothetical protein